MGRRSTTQRLTETNLIVCDAREVFVGHHRYQDTPLEQIVTGLLESPALASWPAHAPAVPLAVSAGAEPRSPDSARMTTARVIEAANEFVEAHPEVPLVSDTGDCLFAAVEIQSNDCVAPAYYATMGCAGPAALGLQVSSGRRPLVLVGDGAFQMTGSEIAHAGPLGCNPIVVLLNKHWADAGRDGRPYIVALGGRADPERIAHLESIGVDEIVIGLPDKDEDEVLAFIAKMGARLH